jgi:hypothetical protein
MMLGNYVQTYNMSAEDDMLTIEATSESITQLHENITIIIIIISINIKYMIISVNKIR